MSVTVDAIADLSAAWIGGSIISPWTIGNGANRVLYVVVCYRNPSMIGFPFITQITFNGSLMTREVSQSNGSNLGIEIFRMTAPPITAATINITWGTPPQQASWGAVSYFGVDQTTPTVLTFGAAGTTSDPLLEPTVNGGLYALIAGLWQAPVQAAVPTSPGTFPLGWATQSDLRPNGGSPQVTGWRTASNAVDAIGVGTIAWASVANAQGAPDAAYAFATHVATTQSHWLQTSNYGFSNTDFGGKTGCTIVGIEVRYTRHAIAAGTTDASMLIMKAGTRTGTDHSAGAAWQVTTDEQKVFGGQADLFGTTWLQTDITNVQFGAAISELTTTGGTASVDSVEIRVWYLPADNAFWMQHGSYGGGATTPSVSLPGASGTDSYTVAALTINPVGGASVPAFRRTAYRHDFGQRRR